MYGGEQDMNVVEAVWQNGQVVLEGQADWPEGRRLLVVELPPATSTSEKIGLTEAEWDDSPEGRAKWSAWLQSLEPVEFAKPDSFDEEFRRFNIEAVRKQMSGDNT